MVYQPLHGRIFGLKADTHAALAELLDELVVADRGADHHDTGIVALCARC